MSEVTKDPITGTDTTGHEWDGIAELNNPLPKWWLYVLYATIVWAIGYWVLYPAWPTLSGYTQGVLGYSSRAELTDTMAAVEESRAPWKAKFADQDIAAIAQDRELLTYAMAGGKAIFADNCAPCHGAGGSGAEGGYPVLADDDWIWGGTLEDIQTTIVHGIRTYTDEDTRDSIMPAFLADELLEPADIAEVTNHVLSLSGQAQGTEAGATIYEENCAACHGDDGKGLAELGAPNLADGIWLYGGTAEQVAAQIGAPKHGVMPPWAGRLDDVEIKQVTIYVHALGGGQ